MGRDNDQPSQRGQGDERSERSRLGRWQKLLLFGSIAFMVLGIALQASGWLSGSEGDRAGGAGSALAPSSFAATDDAASTDTGADEDDGLLDAWSPAIFRLGFSFFVGFAIAFALRSFIKITLVTAGFILLLLFGLQYANIIDVEWTAVQGHYESVSGWLAEQTSSFKEFVQGYLPSTAAAGVGFFTGFRRR